MIDIFALPQHKVVVESQLKTIRSRSPGHLYAQEDLPIYAINHTQTAIIAP